MQKTIDLTPEARERVERIVTGAFDLGHSITVEDLRGIIATELTAVRAALVAEMVAGVRDLEWEYRDGIPVRYLQREQVLTYLRATAQEIEANG